MRLKISQKNFVHIAFVLFTLLPAVATETEDSHSRLCYTLSKAHHEMLT